MDNDQNFKREMESLGINVGDVVDVNDGGAFGGIGEDVVIDTKPKKGIGSIVSNLGIFKIITIAAIMLMGIVIITLSLSFKFTTEDVVGTSMKVGPLHLISNEYVVNQNDIKPGSVIIYTNQRDKAYMGPVLYKYTKTTVSRISGSRLYVEQAGTKDLAIIDMQNVLYVVNVQNQN